MTAIVWFFSTELEASELFRRFGDFICGHREGSGCVTINAEPSTRLYGDTPRQFVDLHASGYVIEGLGF